MKAWWRWHEAACGLHPLWFDAIPPASKIIIIDDLLATGGTVDACVKLCQQQGAEVIGNLFVIELEGLGAREKLHPIPCESLLLYPA